MAGDETFIINPKDPISIVRLQHPTVIEQLLESPPTVLAELLAGWFSTGNGFMAAAGCRIAQGAFKGRVFEQFAREFKFLREKGKIPDDFAEKKYGGKSWVELLTILDEEMPDEDRLEALKAMFYSVNKVNVGDGERILAYQLFQIAKKLSSGDLLVLKEALTLSHGTGHDSAQNWLAKIANAFGHGVTALIEQHERVLVEYGLISPRFDQNLKVTIENGRLTDLGLAFCRHLQTYAEVSSPS